MAEIEAEVEEGVARPRRHAGPRCRGGPSPTRSPGPPAATLLFLSGGLGPGHPFDTDDGDPVGGGACRHGEAKPPDAPRPDLANVPIPDLARVADVSFSRAYELRRLERAAALPSDATRLERLLAYEPVCGPAPRHRAVLLRRLGRELGLESY
jgi:hypothetical protein